MFPVNFLESINFNEPFLFCLGALCAGLAFFLLLSTIEILVVKWSNDFYFYFKHLLILTSNYLEGSYLKQSFDRNFRPRFFIQKELLVLQDELVEIEQRAKAFENKIKDTIEKEQDPSKLIDKLCSFLNVSAPEDEIALLDNDLQNLKNRGLALQKEFSKHNKEFYAFKEALSNYEEKRAIFFQTLDCIIKKWGDEEEEYEEEEIKEYPIGVFISAGIPINEMSGKRPPAKPRRTRNPQPGATPPPPPARPGCVDPKPGSPWPGDSDIPNPNGGFPKPKYIDEEKHFKPLVVHPDSPGGDEDQNGGGNNNGFRIKLINYIIRLIRHAFRIWRVMKYIQLVLSGQVKITDVVQGYSRLDLEKLLNRLTTDRVKFYELITDYIELAKIYELPSTIEYLKEKLIVYRPEHAPPLKLPERVELPEGVNYTSNIYEQHHLARVNLLTPPEDPHGVLNPHRIAYVLGAERTNQEAVYLNSLNFKQVKIEPMPCNEDNLDIFKKSTLRDWVTKRDEQIEKADAFVKKRTIEKCFPKEVYEAMSQDKNHYPLQNFFKGQLEKLEREDTAYENAQRRIRERSAPDYCGKYECSSDDDGTPPENVPKPEDWDDRHPKVIEKPKNWLDLQQPLRSNLFDLRKRPTSIRTSEPALLDNSFIENIDHADPVSANPPSEVRVSRIKKLFEEYKPREAITKSDNNPSEADNNKDENSDGSTSLLVKGLLCGVAAVGLAAVFYYSGAYEALQDYFKAKA